TGSMRSRSGTITPVRRSSSRSLDANGPVECYQFIFTEKAANDPVADHKLNVVEIDHSSARDLQQLLEIAHQANAASTPDPHPAMAPQDTAKVQVQHHQDAFHLA